MPEFRPPIPEAVKRAVRQRCGFGCVICGLPLYEYEHMEGWANVERHVASEITLLCAQHHKERTLGLLTLESVREADRNPRNLGIGQSQPLNLNYDHKYCEIVIGGNTFRSLRDHNVSTVKAIAIDDNPLLAFSFEDGQLLITAQIYDRTGNRILWIDRNELAYCTSAWDIEWVGRKLRIREGKGRVTFEVQFVPPLRIEVLRGYLAYNGYEFVVHRNRLYYLNQAVILSGLRFSFFETALSVSNELRGSIGWQFPGVNRNFEEISREEIVKIFRTKLKEQISFSPDNWATVRPRKPERAELVNLSPAQLNHGGAQPVESKIYIGESETCLVCRVGENQPQFELLEQPLLVRCVGEKLYVSFTILNDSGNTVAVLTDNEWTPNTENAWDRNYTDNMLEVLNPDGEVILQARLDGDAVRLQFKVVGPNGQCAALWSQCIEGQIVGMAEHAFTATQRGIIPGFRRLFRYPSEQHFGERADGSFSRYPISATARVELAPPNIAETEEWPYSVKTLDRDMREEILEIFPLGYCLIGREGSVHHFPERAAAEKPIFRVSADWDHARLKFVPFVDVMTVFLPELEMETDTFELSKSNMEVDLSFVEGPAKRHFHKVAEPTMYFTVVSAHRFHPVVLVSFRLGEPL